VELQTKEKMVNLIAAYQQPWRHYHTLQHLNECLTLFESCRDLAEFPDEIEAALWFHDAVYNIPVEQCYNELQSMKWATIELTAAHFNYDSINRIQQLILITCHKFLPKTPDQKLIKDIDLAILGAPRGRFIEYEAQIKREYKLVPNTIFYKNRQEILKGFLAQDSIYNTPRLYQSLESKARKNLKWTLKQHKLYGNP
jgi:predicted metal-dependent HD superfamily phosphohydrolase